MMLERFSRGTHQHISGSGLGLSIVQRIVQLHQCQLTLDTASTGQGLRVIIGCFKWGKI
jgi:signal transduction histidine kinase